MAQMRHVLLTGASGDIGTRLRTLLQDVYDLRLSDISQPENLRDSDQFFAADLTDLSALERAAEGMEGIIHLGGIADEAPWEAILSANIIGTYNLFEAARR